MKIRKAILPLGGLGTRFLPITKVIPKEMLPIIDKPLIQYAVEEALTAGIEEFIFVTGRGKSVIQDYFDHSFELEQELYKKGKHEQLKILTSLIKAPGNISYIRQQQPLGLGHAIWCARHLIGDEPFAVLLVDDFINAPIPCLKQMTDAYESGVMAAVMKVNLEQVNKYGIVDIKYEQDFLIEIKSLIEKPHPSNAPSNFAIIGRYILDANIFEHLSHQNVGIGGEIQLTDALLPMILKMPFYGYKFRGDRYDCGSKDGFLAANIAMGLERKELTKQSIDQLTQVFKKNNYI